MDARECWQALQARLKSARAAFDAGDRETALAEVTAALALDSEFLAAHALRDRILAMDTESSHRALSPAAPSHLAPQPSLPAGYAKFEQRAKRRRVDRKLDAARAALDQQRLKAAAAALDEVIELDPNLPELSELTARFDDLRRSAATPRRGAWATAAAVFAVALFGGSWLQDATPIMSRQILSAAPLPAPLAPTVTVPEGSAEVGTTGVREPGEPPVTTTAPVNASVADAAATAPGTHVGLMPPTVVRPLADPIEPPPPPARALDALAAAPDAATIVPASTTISSLPPTREDDALIKQTLQRYRSAYETLDVQSARAVWPAASEAALTRAFDGLESQSLTFDACDVHVYGESATATCHGSAQYVPKVGSREPRVEPRIWNFTLRKAGSDWKIDSARADR